MMQIRNALSYAQAANTIAQKDKDIKNLESRFNISIQSASVVSEQLQAYVYLDKGKWYEKRLLSEDADRAFQKALKCIHLAEVAAYRIVAKENLMGARVRIEKASKYDPVEQSLVLYENAIQKFKLGRKLEAKGNQQACVDAYFAAADIADEASERITGSRFRDLCIRYIIMLALLLFPLLSLLALLF